MKTKKFNKYEKRAIFSGRLTQFKEIIDDSLTYPFHKEKKIFDEVTPAWEYENYRHGIIEGDKFLCYAKASYERQSEKEIGIRSDHTISSSKFSKDEILKISTKDMYMYPGERKENTGFIYIKIKSAKVEIIENTFWWKYNFEFLGNVCPQ